MLYKCQESTSGYWLWSGDILMDLDRYQALKMRLENVDDEDYLFVEAGGFKTGNKPDWKTPFYVMKRRGK